MVAKGNVAHRRAGGGKARRGLGQRRMLLAHLSRPREATYRLLSQTFLRPDEERARAVAEAARALRQEGATSLARFAFFGEWSRLLRFLEDFVERRIEDIQREYVSLFVANSRGLPCPPYESVYREPAGRPTGWLLAQVEGEYAAAGLAPSPDLGELPDHVAVEMEFMAVLCGRETQAWEERNLAQGVDALRRQAAFLDRHLALWLPAFARELVAADSGGAYAVVAEAAEALISYDRDLLGMLLETLLADDPEGGELQCVRRGST